MTNTIKSKEKRRYSLVLPEDLYNELEQVAKDRHTSVVDIIRRFIKLGLLAVKTEDAPDTAIIFREGETEREVIFM
jgi:hypothetical protein